MKCIPVVSDVGITQEMFILTIHKYLFLDWLAVVFTKVG